MKNNDTELEIYVSRRISELEMKTYDHADNVEDITNQILEIVEVSGVKDYKIKLNIADSAILLLEEFRFE